MRINCNADPCYKVTTMLSTLLFFDVDEVIFFESLPSNCTCRAIYTPISLKMEGDFLSLGKIKD